MSSELQALKQELQQKGSHNRLQDEELISAMREQVQNTHTHTRACTHTHTHTHTVYLSPMLQLRFTPNVTAKRVLV